MTTIPFDWVGRLLHFDPCRYLDPLINPHIPRKCHVQPSKPDQLTLMLQYRFRRPRIVRPTRDKDGHLSCGGRGASRTTWLGLKVKSLQETVEVQVQLRQKWSANGGVLRDGG